MRLVLSQRWDQYDGELDEVCALMEFGETGNKGDTSK